MVSQPILSMSFQNIDSCSYPLEKKTRPLSPEIEKRDTLDNGNSESKKESQDSEEMLHNESLLEQYLSGKITLNDIETQIIVASVRNPIHVSQAARMGADIATVPYKVITQMAKHPLTDKGIENFLKDWEGASLKL